MEKLTLNTMDILKPVEISANVRSYFKKRGRLPENDPQLFRSIYHVHLPSWAALTQIVCDPKRTISFLLSSGLLVQPKCCGKLCVLTSRSRMWAADWICGKAPSCFKVNEFN